jgi:lysozyme
MITKLREMLIQHEGLRLKPYRCTAGKLTIGVGRNLDDVGITEPEAMMLLENDIDKVISDLQLEFSWFGVLDEVRMIAICDMCFNLGLAGLKNFKKMLAAMAVADYETAADEAMDSRWYTQTGRRSVRIVYMLRTGKMEV